MLPVTNLKAYLIGDWSVERLISDRARGMSGRLNGQATFTPSASGLLYEERGMLSFGAHCGPAEQSYRFDFPQGLDHASVFFRDGRPFHDLNLSRGSDRVDHGCHPDCYAGLFVALSSTEWRCEWRVTGPRKDYDLVTTYTRPNVSA